MRRREFLQLVTRAGLAAPALGLPFGCAPALTVPDSTTGLSLGYVAGDVTEHSAIIWVRAEPGSRVGLHYGADPSLRNARSVEPLGVDAGADYSARFHLTQLAPATRHYYRALVVGKKAGPIGAFTTAPQM